MAAARGLGKGLDALIPSGISSSSGSTNSSKAKEDKSSEKKLDIRSPAASFRLESGPGCKGYL